MEEKHEIPKVETFKELLSLANREYWGKDFVLTLAPELAKVALDAAQRLDTQRKPE